MFELAFSFQDVFDAIDGNGDGVISRMEFAYGLLQYQLNSGPDSLMSLWMGPVMDEE